RSSPVASKVELLPRIDCRQELERIELYAANIHLLKDRANRLAAIVLGEADDGHRVFLDAFEDVELEPPLLVGNVYATLFPVITPAIDPAVFVEHLVERE